MARHVRRMSISPRDLLLREAAVCDYVGTWVAQVVSLLEVTRLNYPLSFAPLSQWAVLAQSLQHQTVERSRLLSFVAQHASNPMLVTKMSYSQATAICSALFEAKNEG